MRVFPNNDGSELVFTLYRRPDVSDQEFAEDAKSVEKDLAKSNALLEKGATGGESRDYNAEAILWIKFHTTP